MSAQLYFAYIAACVVIAIVPGPTATLIIGNSLKHGGRAGLLNVVGAQFGALILIGIIAVGLTTAVEAMGHWFEWIRLAGAAYLIWLGWKMLRDHGGEAAQDAKTATPPRIGFFLQGCLVTLSNPKTLLFLGAFLPQFIDSSRDQTTQMIILGVTVMFIAGVADGFYALIASRAGRALSRNSVRWLSRISGACLMGGGVWLAFSRAR